MALPENLGRMVNKNLFNKVPLPFCTISSKGEVLDANDLFTSLFNIASSEKRMGIYDYLAQTEKDRFELWIEEGIKNGDFSPTLFSCKLGGKFFRLLFNAVAEAGISPLQINCTITLIEKAEQKRKDQSSPNQPSDEYFESQERFSKAFQYASIGMALVAPDGTWLKVNQSVCHLVGYSENELMQLTFQDITHPDDLDLDLGYVLKMLEGKIQTYKIEKRYFHKKGNIVWVLLSVSLVRSRDGAPLYFISQLEDITEWKHTQEALRKNEERFQLLVSGTNLGIWEWNKTGKRDYLSDKFCELTGYTQEELDSNMNNVFNLIHPKHRDSVSNRLKSYSLRNNPFNVEVLLKKKNGEYGWFLFAGRAQLDENREIIKVIGYTRDITEKKRANTQFEGLFNSSPEGILIIDDSKNIKIANDQTTILFGCSKKEIEGKPITDFIPELFLEQKYLNSNHIERNNEFETNIELSITGKNGVHTPVEVVLNPLESSVSKSMIVTIRDISTRLKNIEERTKILTALDETTDGIFMFEPDTLRHIYVNSGASKQIGYTEKELLKMMPFDFKSEYNEESYRQLIKPLVSGQKKSLFMETVHRHKNGNYIDVEIIFKLAKLDQDQKVIVAVVRDIVERKQAEEALLLSEERYRQLYENSTFGIYRISKEGEIVLANPALIKLLGFDSLEELKKRDLQKEGFSKHSKRQEFIALMEEQGRVSDYESVWMKKNGEYIYIRENAKLTIDEKTGEHFYDATIEDITEKRQIEKERIARQAAEEANRSKSIFLANMSHEIRTPLNSIIGFSNLLQTSLKDPKKKSQVASIRSSGKTLLSIINDILDLSKIEAGKMKLNPEPTNLVKLLRDIKQVISPLAKDKNIKFYVKTEIAEDLNLLIDEVRVKQMLFNLIGNAVKFTERGYVNLYVNIIPRNSETSDIFILIEDTGIGIPKDQLKSIFEPFTQQEGQPEKIFGGTGLGLTIVKQIVDMMNGTIKVTSKVGMGSKFKISLPEIYVDDDVVLKDNDTDFDPSTIKFDKAKVLIVDDNKYNRELIKDFLAYSPLELLEAGNGHEAVKLSQIHKPDLILMDLKMPVMSGVKASNIIRKSKKTSHVPIIAISASVGSNINDQAELKIFDEFLLKPLVFSTFAEVLKRYLKYKLIAKAQEQTNKKKRKVKGGNLHPDTLDELVKKLKEDFIPQQESALKGQVINQIEDFGRKLMTLAEGTSCTLLYDYAEEICEYTERFEIKKLMDSLIAFPQLIDKITEQQ